MSERTTQFPPPTYDPPQPPPEYPPPATPQPPPPPAAGSKYGAGSGVRPSESLAARARANDQEALQTMFGQFLPEGEQSVDCQYLGVLGLWGIGTHSFAAVTPRRAATLQMSMFGGIHYQEGALEHVNSAAVHQPSKASLYISVAIYGLVALFWSIGLGVVTPVLGVLAGLIAIAFVPLYVKFYYRRHKSGLVLIIREGAHLYAFIDRKRMVLANRLFRQCMNLREERLRALGQV